MPLVGGFVFPHGAITLDPDTRDLTGQPAYLPTTKENCIKLHNAMKSQAELLVATRPDLIILTTPHGLRLQNEFMFFNNAKAYGSAEWNGDWKEFTVELTIANSVTTDMSENLRTNGNLVESLSFASSADNVLPLAWGEAVPFWFINEAYKTASVFPPKILAIGIPTKRLTVPSSQIIPELLKLGEDIWSFVKSKLSNLKVAVVISCDLSHYHSKDPTSPYQYDEDAVPFDNFCVDWGKIDIDKSQIGDDSPSNQSILMSGAGSLADHIGSCGYTGLVLLHGILMACVKDEDGSFKAKFLEYSWPTYYGMMVTSFVAE